MNKQNKSVCRRRSRSLVGFASKTLCEAIPKSLSPSERLMMLVERSFQYALSVTQKEVMLGEDFDISSFRQKGTEYLEKVKTFIEEKNLDKSSVAKNGLCESYVEAKVEECNEAVSLMEAESQIWKDQISYHRESLENEIDSAYSISSSDLKNENQLYDYSNILRQTSEVEEKIYQQIKIISRTEATIKKCSDLLKVCDSALHKRCEKYYGLKVSHTPRTLIRRFASVRKNIKPYQDFQHK